MNDMELLDASARERSKSSPSRMLLGRRLPRLGKDARERLGTSFIVSEAELGSRSQFKSRQPVVAAVGGGGAHSGTGAPGRGVGKTPGGRGPGEIDTTSGAVGLRSEGGFSDYNSPTSGSKQGTTSKETVGRQSGGSGGRQQSSPTSSKEGVLVVSAPAEQSSRTDGQSPDANANIPLDDDKDVVASKVPSGLSASFSAAFATEIADLMNSRPRMNDHTLEKQVKKTLSLNVDDIWEQGGPAVEQKSVSSSPRDSKPVVEERKMSAKGFLCERKLSAKGWTKNDSPNDSFGESREFENCPPGASVSVSQDEQRATTFPASGAPGRSLPSHQEYEHDSTSQIAPNLPVSECTRTTSGVPPSALYATNMSQDLAYPPRSFHHRSRSVPVLEKLERM